MGLGGISNSFLDLPLIKRHLPSILAGSALLLYGSLMIPKAFEGKSMGSLIALDGKLERAVVSESASEIEFRFGEYPGRGFLVRGATPQDKEAAKTLEQPGDKFEFSVAEQAFRDYSKHVLPVYQMKSANYRYVSRKFSSFSHDEGKLLGGIFGIVLCLGAVWLLGTFWEHHRNRSDASDPLIVFTACHPRKAAAILFALPAVYSWSQVVAAGCGAGYVAFLVWFQIFGSRISWIQREREIHAAQKARLTSRPETEVPQEIKMIEELIKRNAVDTPNSAGQTPLHLACAAGRADAIELLLRNGAKINRQDNEGKTPLIHAAARGHLPVVMKLVERFPDFNLTDNKGWTALKFAQAVGKESVVQVLKNAAGRKPALHAAAASGDVGRIHKLVKSGLDIDAKDAEGQTALMVAVKRNALGAVTELLKLGANQTTPDKSGLTPLQAAENAKRAEIVKVLKTPPPKDGAEEKQKAA